MPKEKRAAWLLERRDEIIGKLNRDFSKPWFGWKKDGSVAKELGDMTYEETVLRMVRLMFVAHEQRWIDVSLRNLTGDWLRRVEERFAGVNGGGQKPSLLQSYKSLEDPLPFIKSFLNEYPIATKQLLAAEDSAYLLAISQRPGHKPVPFIPVLDATFEVWFKKDSLWAAEDIEAVFDQDPQRVKDEPIKDMLGNIHAELIQRLLASKTTATKAKFPPSTTSLPIPFLLFSVVPCIKRTQERQAVDALACYLGSAQNLGRSRAEPVARFDPFDDHRVQGTSYIDNPIKRLLAPRTGQKIVVCYENGAPVSVPLYARSYGEHKELFKAVEIKYSPTTKLIDITIFEDRRDVSVPLSLQFEYKPSMGAKCEPLKPRAERASRHTHSRPGKPVIEVVSAFLYRGRFTDYENTFETTEEPDYVVKLETDAAVGVLQSKEWFEWIDESKPLNVTVTGQVFVRNQLKELIPVGSIDFEPDDGRGNPVVAYIQRHGVAQGLSTPLPNEGYTLNSTPISFHAPLTNEPYSKVSGDFNPIHINPYFSDYASLPATITHGLDTLNAFSPTTSRSLAWSFLVTNSVSKFATLACGMEASSSTLPLLCNSRGEKVLGGSAEVSQPTTVNVFTGQGSQEQGMGMDLYNSLPAARAVWDGADTHLLAVYGFSIVEIVKDNPKEKTIHFGGIKGQAIRRRYMDMTYDTMDKDGNVKTRSSRTLMFARPSIPSATRKEKAAFEDMRMKGFVQKDCAFAGHSLGEYSALASIADVLHISALVDVVFYRGITMRRRCRA
ncbi:Fatty acid synthase subunit alpha [Mycena indigotica]|uniref:Fatty acid synthase subunit alpha n=1 Tax=Mycena indigotica TaxID=2126181 RepID=A0A8H6WAL2_9AGAR|nr:Fatty acid synthase subunit alpha [Mycena indigotica]KAF7311699.1 Fatty acid synthase subunit alpha [Mycena indigotica]